MSEHPHNHHYYSHCGYRRWGPCGGRFKWMTVAAGLVVGAFLGLAHRASQPTAPAGGTFPPQQSCTHHGHHGQIPPGNVDQQRTGNQT